ncbi:MAG: CRISPR-associated protein Cas4 [Anaerolineae bacterium]|nr:CRISPR-associated protein Cas4 [Anaerolineae bacterium]
MLDETRWLFTVTDLKQYMYCPRILYYQTCLPTIRPITYKMRAGVEAHGEERQRASRRSTQWYGLPEGQHLFDVSVQSSTLGLSGQIDEVVQTATEMVPVDYKMARQVGYHYKVQLAAYAMMLEETYQTQIRRGVIYLIPTRKANEVPITRALRQQVLQTLDTMRAIAEREAMPPPTDWRQRCADCEFRRFCNDV